MVGMRTLVVLLLISVVFPTAARGQDAGLSPGQVDELKKWVSLRLNTFTLPGTTQKFVSHLNFTNARIMDGFSNFADRAGLSLMGLSFTVKK